MNKRIIAVVAAVALAGCAVTQPLPPKLDLPQGSATPEQNAGVLSVRWGNPSMPL